MHSDCWKKQYLRIRKERHIGNVIECGTGRKSSVIHSVDAEDYFVRIQSQAGNNCPGPK